MISDRAKLRSSMASSSDQVKATATGLQSHPTMTGSRYATATALDCKQPRLPPHSMASNSDQLKGYKSTLPCQAKVMKRLGGGQGYSSRRCRQSPTAPACRSTARLRYRKGDTPRRRRGRPSRSSRRRREANALIGGRSAQHRPAPPAEGAAVAVKCREGGGWPKRWTRTACWPQDWVWQAREDPLECRPEGRREVRRGCWKGATGAIRRRPRPAGGRGGSG